MTNRRVDLNCDLGESPVVGVLEHDVQIMPSITSANVACGYHAGDPSVMRATVRLLVEHGVAIGAHPGFRDLAGFGRRVLTATPAEVEDLVLYQVGALTSIVTAEGGRLIHVKPHGALYNVAAAQPPIATAVARAVALFDQSLILVGLSGSCLLDAGRAAGLTVVSEAFADRGYRPDGTLAPRSMPGAVIDAPAIVIDRAVGMVTTGRLSAIDGTSVNVTADTICVHGDTPGAVELAAGIRSGLESAGISVVGLGS